MPEYFLTNKNWKSLYSDILIADNFLQMGNFELPRKIYENSLIDLCLLKPEIPAETFETMKRGIRDGLGSLLFYEFKEKSGMGERGYFSAENFLKDEKNRENPHVKEYNGKIEELNRLMKLITLSPPPSTHSQ
jgi:hypothetical protein